MSGGEHAGVRLVRVEEAQDLRVARSAADRCAALAVRLEALHPYELPELLFRPVSGVGDRYPARVLSESTP